MKKILALAFGLALAGTSSAFAHASLLNQTPPDKAIVTAAPTQLTLKFSESVELKFTGVTVTGPDKIVVALGSESLDPKDPTLLIVPLTGKLPAGVYTVAWHALATDGHKTSGSYTFTVK
jgi:methionine-rich copper-binding protein CopC